MKRTALERVVHAVQPRLGCGAGERVLDVFGAAAGAREEVRDRGGAFVGDDLPGGRGDRGIRRGGVRGGAGIDLRARVGVDVEARPTGVGGEGVRARRDGLRLECGGGPARGHLRGDDAADVRLEQRDDLLVHATDHLEEVATGLSDVVELAGQEVVALLQRPVLALREEVHPA